MFILVKYQANYISYKQYYNLLKDEVTEVLQNMECDGNELNENTENRESEPYILFCDLCCIQSFNSCPIK
jgi:hypothetical protein